MMMRSAFNEMPFTFIHLAAASKVLQSTRYEEESEAWPEGGYQRFVLQLLQCRRLLLDETPIEEL